MEIVAKQMLNLLTDYKTFGRVYELDGQDPESVYEIENAFMSEKWKLYFDTHGSWEEFSETLIDEPGEDEFLFYLARYLEGYYYNVSIALKQALAIIWQDDISMSDTRSCSPRRG